MKASYVAGILLIILVIGFAAYYFTRPTPPPPTTTPPPTLVGTGKKVATMFDIGGRGDLGFNDLAALGSDRANETLGVEVTFIQPRTEADYLPKLRELCAEEEYEMIVGVGWLLTDAMHTVAQEYPNQLFGIVDSATEDPNVRGILFAEHEGSALIGLLAGLVTESDIVAAVLGMEIPVLWKFEAGYYYGINYAENLTGKDITILYKYTGTFIDRAAGKLVSEGFIAQGADVLYNIAGLTGVGALDAVAEYDEAQGIEYGPPFAVGVDANQDYLYPGHVIASMLKRVDNGVYFTFRDAIYGNFTGGPTFYGIPERGIGISRFEDLDVFMDIAIDMGVTLPDTKENITAAWVNMRAQYSDEDVWDVIDAFEQAILAGDVVIPEPATIEDVQAIRDRYGAGELPG